ncbi:FtsX-like permease family protein [Evtepia gabavorous]|uniref:FtsX-like permease family protein n=1 Tax=Evtepia gabavorous TaxID=2211183 RepID=UPI003AB6787F
MYGKLILRSARRSVQDYLIYLVTLTLCVGLFYAFLSISSRYYHPALGAEFDLSFLSEWMKLAICGVTLLLLFLIRYVNRYMIRQKQQEFAMQTILGMEQRTTAWLFFGETFLMGLLSLGLGIPLGSLLSQFITAMLLSSYGQSFQLSWALFPDTSALTLLFFSLSFFVVGLFNVRSIQKLHVIDMLQARRKNEDSLKKSRWMPVVTILYLAALAGIAAMNLWYASLYYDSRLPLLARIFYVSNAVLPLAGLAGSGLWCFKRRRFLPLLAFLLVQSLISLFFIALAPWMDRTYSLPISQESLRSYLLFFLVYLSFFLCTVMYLSSRLLSAWKDKSPAHKYTGENLFFYGQVLSKLRSASKSMTLISLTLVLSTVLFALSPALSGWAEGYLEERAIYDVQINSYYNNVLRQEDLPQDTYDFVPAFLEARGIQITQDRVFSLYLPEASQFHNRNKYDFPVVAVALSDYNAIRQMLGYPPISLGAREFSTQWDAISTPEDQVAFLRNHPTLSTDAGTLSLAQDALHTESMGETFYNLYTHVTYVLPDQVCHQLLPVMTKRYLATAHPIPYADAAALQDAFSTHYPEQSLQDGPEYSLDTRTQQISDTKSQIFLFHAVMVYGAVVLMVICFTILSLQQLWDANQYRYRFGVLRKLGVEDRSIHHLISKQLALWFGLPVGLAVLISGAISAFFFWSIATEINAYLGFDALLSQVSALAGILLLLLLAYALSTWTLFRQAVSP